MSDQKNLDLKKGVPGNFILFIIASIIFILMVQNFLETKFAKVSFSYQLEHLVNLGLIQPEESRKTVVDNMVTFSGKFRDRLPEDSKNRYKFLELLNTNHELVSKKKRLEDDVENQKGKIKEAATVFLQLSGTPILSNGYVVIDNLYSPIDQGQGLTIKQIPSKETLNLKSLQEQFPKIKTSSDETQVLQFGKSLGELTHDYLSPLLGIGSESVKRQLRAEEQSLLTINQPGAPINQQISEYSQGLQQLSQITDQLNRDEGGIRLNLLRSVRNYKDLLKEYEQLITTLDDNQAQLDKARQSVSNVIWFFNNKELSTRSLEKQDPEVFHHWFLNAKEEWDSFKNNRGAYFKAPGQPSNLVLEKTFRSEEPPPKYLSYLFPALLAFGVLLALYVLFARQMKGVGSSAMNFGKSPAKLVVPKGENRVTFADVAGVDEALEELEEIVEFLKNPQKFTSLGGRIPKGVLCIGPPGTGKTLIAKAVAGEADRPFFSISGSDFVEMFVGVGASRIRDLFDQAKKNAPCIIFMDEIDAVGRHRGAGIGGGHDEREQTLNQLLVEMDGFDTNEGVILMAATNRPDVLDKALLRPGRFDRRVIIGLPDVKGRYDILKVHARKIKLDSSVELMNLARSTPGCSGADLANMLNEAALLAARKGRSAITMQEVMESRDKVLYGKERRSLEIDEHDKKTTAYHESGHAIVSLKVKHAEPIDKVTIIPRGLSLGATMFMPKKNKTSYWKNEVLDQLAVLMGGRCAEEIFIGDISSGARQDIEQATKLARAMVCEWGMSDKLGAVAYDERNGGEYVGMAYHEKKYSEATAREIDNEVRIILDHANQVARDIITTNKEVIEEIVRALIKYETLDPVDLDEILTHQWSDEKKDQRVKVADELHKKNVTPPPPPSDINKPEAAFRHPPIEKSAPA